MKCKQTLAAYAVFAAAAIITAIKGTIDWMGFAVIGGILLPGARRFIVNLFSKKHDSES